MPHEKLKEERLNEAKITIRTRLVQRRSQNKIEAVRDGAEVPLTKTSPNDPKVTINYATLGKRAAAYYQTTNTADVNSEYEFFNLLRERLSDRFGSSEAEADAVIKRVANLRLNEHILAVNHKKALVPFDSTRSVVASQPHYHA